MTERAITEEDLVHAYNLDPDDGIAHLESLGVPNDVAELVQSWHSETDLLDYYKRLMRKRGPYPEPRV